MAASDALGPQWKDRAYDKYAEARFRVYLAKNLLRGDACTNAKDVEYPNFLTRLMGRKS